MSGVDGSVAGADAGEPGSVPPVGPPVGQPLAGWVERAWPPGVTLRGRTCVLEVLDARHVDDLTAAWADTDEAHWTYLPMERPVGRAGVAQVVESMAADPTTVAYAVMVSGRAFGVLSLMRIDPANGVIEIGAVVFGTALVRTVASTQAQRLLMGARAR